MNEDINTIRKNALIKYALGDLFPYFAVDSVSVTENIVSTSMKISRKGEEVCSVITADVVTRDEVYSISVEVPYIPSEVYQSLFGENEGELSYRHYFNYRFYNEDEVVEHAVFDGRVVTTTTPFTRKKTTLGGLLQEKLKESIEA